ncbi:MAG TPA: HepT-like ribonuclease domain-containing protein [Burkholderiales bacterium]|jgi:uncharacterized protein with HEPN domain
MPLEARKYLYDIQQALELIEGFCAGKSFPDYQQDPMLRSAIERQLEIVGEAVTRLAQLNPALAEKLTEYRRIIAFRNILIHAYATIDDRIVWGVIEGRLPQLRVEVRNLLAADTD